MKNRGIMLDRGSPETALAQIVTILNGSNAELDKIGISLADFINLVVADITAMAGVFKSKNFEDNYRKYLSDFVYPVGSYYETSLSEDDFNPNNYWAGEWILESDESSVGGGRVHVSASDDYDLGEVGGEEDVTLTVENLPSHRHDMGEVWSGGADEDGESAYTMQGDRIRVYRYTGYTGGDVAHNNMQPYVVVNRWHRIS